MKSNNKKKMPKEPSAGNGTKPNVSRRFIVGIATGSNDIETWAYDGSDFSDKLCKSIVSNTGRSVYVIEGKIIGKYHYEEPPVIFTPSENGG